MLRRGTAGRVYTPHRCDGDYSARARLAHDSTADQELVTVVLLECFYCLSAGDEITTARYLFRPDEGSDEGSGTRGQGSGKR